MQFQSVCFKLPLVQSEGPMRLMTIIIWTIILCLLPFTVSAENGKPASSLSLSPDESQGDFSYCRSGLCGGDLEMFYPISVLAAVVYDGDLVVGGYFAAADGEPVQHLTRWDGTAWYDLGGGVSSTWGSVILAMTIYNDQLIVAGKFKMAGDSAANSIAAWDGASWHALGNGIYGEVRALCSYDGQLIVGGNFDSAGTVAVNDIATWDGSTWSDMPGISSNNGMSFEALTVYDDKLIASGRFDTPAPGGTMAQWDGSSWSSMGSGLQGPPQALIVYNEELIAAGTFTTAAGSDANQIAVWNGSSWDPIGSGMINEETDYQSGVYSLTIHDGQLIAGGIFTHANGVPVGNIAAWNGLNWSSLGSGMEGVDFSLNQVYAITSYDSLIISGGAFVKVAEAPGNRIASWDGLAWKEVTAVEGMPFAFEIETVVPYGGVPFGHYVSVEVKKIGGTEEMYGFDFLIGFDKAGMMPVEIIPGILFDNPGDYEWDYFDFRSDTLIDCVGCPSGVFRAIGVAELNNGSPPAVSTDIPDGTVLFTMEFFTKVNPSLDCTMLPLEFFWIDCGDNSVALEYGDLGISDGVYERIYGEWTEVSDPDAEMPTKYGAPDECLSLGENPVIRFADYVNGGVFMECDTTQIDFRGDINMNGISNEIADMVMFTNYFIFGLVTFGGHAEASIAASDVNADGIVLSVEDLIYLHRIICGNAFPNPAPPAEKIAGDTLTIIQNLSTKTVSIEYSDTLAAIYLIFEGDIIPEFLLNTRKYMCTHFYNGEYTYVLIFPYTPLDPEAPDACGFGFTEGPLFTYSGYGRLVESGDDYRVTGAADFNNNFFSMSPFSSTELRIIGGEGQTSITPQPLPKALARIGESETISMVVGDFAGHDVYDIDQSTVRVNDSIVPISTTILPPPLGFENDVLEIVFSARDFIDDYLCGLDTAWGEYPSVQFLDTLSVWQYVYSIKGQFSDAAEFNTLGGVTIVEGPATIPVPSGWPTIGAAVEMAETKDTVEVDDGAYAGDGNRDISLSGKSLIIRSVNGPESTIIDCWGTESEPHRAFHSTVDEESGSVIDGFQIMNGHHSSGGAISLVHSDLTIRNCIFHSNEADQGGAVYCHGASPTIEYCLFFQNTAENGGAVQCWASSDPYFLNCTFAENTSTSAGAAIYCYNSDPDFRNCLLAYNNNGETIYLLDEGSYPEFYCSDIYGNDGGNWTGLLSYQLGVAGNISEDPMFCDTTFIDFHIDGHSPCAATNNVCFKLIGAYDVGCGTRCGDISNDGRVDVGDVVFLLAYLYRGGPEPADLWSSDLNGNLEFDIGDAVMLINYIFKDGPPLDCINK